MPALLLSTLDNQLPWLITIRIRNFLSYFYITSPVDARVKELRVLANAALLDPDDKRYESYFEECYDYFSSMFELPVEVLKPKVVSSASSYASLAKELITPSPQLLSEQYLENLMKGVILLYGKNVKKV